MPQVAIIGAGPAGLAAAEVLASNGLAVTVFDRMPSPGRRFLIAGRGGLNLTHSEDFAIFLTRYGAARYWLEPALRAFGPDALAQWSEGLGLTTFTGSSGRVFPRAMKASPLLRAWLARLTGAGVTFRFNQSWTGWAPDGCLLMVGADGSAAEVPADATLLALGGASWPRLGADGAWVPLLRRQGIDVAPLLAANVGLRIAWSAQFRDVFAGVPLHNIAAEAQRGEAVVTLGGLEGGAIYPLAPLIRTRLEAGGAWVTLDLRPDLTADDLAARIGRTRPRDSLATRLRKAARLAPVGVGLLREAALLGSGSPALPADEGSLARAIKSVLLPVTGLAGLDRAISSAGGISWDALDEFYALRARPGVFAAGEMLDWEAPTGGYLLQACFATGRWAAHGMLRYLR